MNFFVIMPFEPEFDDVYATIKQTVESCTSTQSGRCFRLDENRPAGRITDRLLSELRAAKFCIADLTGNKPNVMWELGFAMALSKPTIVLTQSVGELPFDIKDMQSIEYQRHHLSTTLGTPLRRMVVDTLASAAAKSPNAEIPQDDNAELVGALLKEMAQLKEIVAEAVHAWKNKESPLALSAPELQSLCGHWINLEGRTHIYISLVHSELVAAYCYQGNDELTGVYFDWRRTGEHWFARYQWVHSSVSGFSFLKRDSVDSLTGAWWSAGEGDPTTDIPPRSEGVPSIWVRQKDRKTAPWAQAFFEEVSRTGVSSFLAKHGHAVSRAADRVRGRS
jgi:hypothetical protein